MPLFSSNIKDMHSKEWNRRAYYDGPLGVSYSPQACRFNLWAPTAEMVSLVLLRENGDEDVLPMSRLTKAPMTWEITIKEDCEGIHYQYRIVFEDGLCHDSPDPYGRACTANGRWTVVLDTENLSPESWTNERLAGLVNPVSSIIYEAHLRDLTISPDNGIQHKGKFLGLTEKDTYTDQGARSGLNYLERLGITHLQLLPLADFSSVDETADLSFNSQYNWGYDPYHYNIPEGSYSTNPHDPKSRILEFKAMIQALHDKGIRVIMDVVYNHVHHLDRSPLQRCVPGYYFRFDENGNPYNGTGCGNETASEQWMFRRYMIDSLSYWAKNFNIDGFRFDLMGIHDVDTMKEIRQVMDEIDPNILLIGEGWKMGNHPSWVTPADQFHADELPSYAFFNDDYRDAIRGSNFDAQSQGFVNGAQSQMHSDRIWLNICGRPKGRPYLSASQSVAYAECHDNLTLWDKLEASLPEASPEELKKRHLLAGALLMVSNGILFIHAGQELMRTKQGDPNSYASPDQINAFPYESQLRLRKEWQRSLELIKWRREQTVLQLNEFNLIGEQFTLVKAEAGQLVFTLSNANVLWYFVFNTTEDDLLAPCKAGPYLYEIKNGSLNAEISIETPVIESMNFSIFRLA